LQFLTKMFVFGSKSKEKLLSADPKLQAVANRALEITGIDFGISEGYRSVKRQQILYAQGRTTPGDIVTMVDGIKKKSKHNYLPSQAIDVYAWVDDEISWDSIYYYEIADSFKEAAKELNINIKWGGDFQGDFKDFAHFELRG